jgi:hypothetical protein
MLWLTLTSLLTERDENSKLTPFRSFFLLVYWNFRGDGGSPPALIYSLPSRAEKYEVARVPGAASSPPIHGIGRFHYSRALCRRGPQNSYNVITRSGGMIGPKRCEESELAVMVLFKMLKLGGGDRRETGKGGLRWEKMKIRLYCTTWTGELGDFGLIGGLL